MMFSAKKFRHYLMYNLVVFCVDHIAIKHFVSKAELSGRLARSLGGSCCWKNLIIRWSISRIGVHLLADHLSRL